MRKNLIFTLIIVISFSCDKKEKYQGVWYDSIYYNSWGELSPERLEIKNDSIHFNYPYFNHRDSYPLTIKNNNFVFNNMSLKAEIDKDSLILNNYNVFTNTPLEGESQYLFDNKSKIKIDLPELRLNNLNYFDYSNNEYINSYIQYGIRHDNGNYSLQLNDRYAQIKDLSGFLSGHHNRHQYFPSNMFFIDKNTLMKHVEEMFLTLALINQLKINFVNNINLKSNDSIGLYYEYEILNKKIPPFQESDKYYESIFKTPLPPPAPSYLFPPSKSYISIIKYVFLIGNEIYYENKMIENVELIELIKQSVKQNHIIFSLYDLESNYGRFLEMTAIINSAYIELREENSKREYNKSLKKLNLQELTKIKTETQMKHIWSFSIPHYKTITKNENLFFGLKVKSIDSLISKSKMDSVTSTE